MIRTVSIVLCGLICSSVCAQNNVPIPMMYQGIQLANPLDRLLQAERIRAQQLQNQQMEEQLRQLRQKAELERQQRDKPTPKQDSDQGPQIDPIISAWLKAAAPRMGMFEDFEKVVFAADVAINVDMIRLITHSKYAADIAYYLGTNKIESLAISQMNLAEAARAIQSIENRIVATAAK